MEHLGQEPKTVKGRDLGNPGRKRCRKIQEKEDKNSQYICPVMPCNQSTQSVLSFDYTSDCAPRSAAPHAVCLCVWRPECQQLEGLGCICQCKIAGNHQARVANK